MDDMFTAERDSRCQTYGSEPCDHSFSCDFEFGNLRLDNVPDNFRVECLLVSHKIIKTSRDTDALIRGFSF